MYSFQSENINGESNMTDHRQNYSESYEVECGVGSISSGQGPTADFCEVCNDV
jgi:hypothetical protein